MRGVNKVILMGNIGSDPEIQTLDGGIKLAKFRLATTEGIKDKNGNRITEWHNIVAWRFLGEFCEKYVRKGDLIFIEGRLRTHSWTDANNNKHYKTEVVADTINIHSRKDSLPKTATDTTAVPVESQVEPGSSDNEVADDLPF